MRHNVNPQILTLIAFIKLPGAGERPGVGAALRPAGEGPVRAGAAAIGPVGASGGGGGLLHAAGVPQGQTGGRVQQPQARPGRARERPVFF